MDVTLRPITEDEWPAYCRRVEAGFGQVATEQTVAGWRRLTEMERTLAAFDGDQIIGTAGAYTLELTVPGGGLVRAAGVTAVGVAPTHRRRGVLRSMMVRQLDDVVALGEPIAVLTASESIIYGRFGYGLATSQTKIALEVRHSAFGRPVTDPGRLRLIDPEESKKLLPGVFDAARRRQPGDVTRSEAFWEIAAEDPEFWREGRPAGVFRVVHEDASGRADGYAVYRYQGKWPDGNPAKVVDVEDWAAADDQVELALWRYLLDLDLVAEVQAWDLPVEHPLRWALADPRRLRTQAVTDHLWVRILDVPAALAARTYGAEDRLVLDVADPFRPESAARYRLDGAGAGAAACVPVEGGEADLALDVSDLGAIYLGGVRPSTLARAGRITEHTPGALRRADQLFAAEKPPWCRTGF